MRYCLQPNCPERVPSGYCAAHQQRLSQDYARHHRQANGSRVHYGRKWRRERDKHLADHPLCHCGGPHLEHCPSCGPIRTCGQVASQVDHKIPHKGDPALFWDQANWQSLAHDCHSRKTATEVWSR